MIYELSPAGPVLFSWTLLLVRWETFFLLSCQNQEEGSHYPAQMIYTLMLEKLVYQYMYILCV